VNLVRAEWSRLFHRRVTLVMTVIVAAVFVTIAIGFAVTSRQPTSAERQRAEELATAARAHWLDDRNYCLDVARGVVKPPPGYSPPPNCDYGRPPNAEAYLPYSFSFRQQIEPLLYTAAILLTLFGFVVGASFVGAEWTSGGITNLLLWRPRRAAVLGAKLAVALGGMLAVGIPYLVVWISAFWGISAAVGSRSLLDAGESASVALTAVRVLVLALFGTVLGFAIASIGRHTAMALGFGIGYIVAYELGTAILFAIFGNQYPTRLRLSTYVVAWMAKRYDFADQTFTCDPSGCFPYARYSLTWVHGGIAFALVSAALIVAAFIVMRTRDVA
jgi:hypothetical protein